MIPQKPYEKNYTIELVRRLFRGLYAKGVQSRTTDNINAKDAGMRGLLFLELHVFFGAFWRANISNL